MCTVSPTRDVKKAMEREKGKRAGESKKSTGIDNCIPVLLHILNEQRKITTSANQKDIFFSLKLVRNYIFSIDFFFS